MDWMYCIILTELYYVVVVVIIILYTVYWAAAKPQSEQNLLSEFVFVYKKKIKQINESRRKYTTTQWKRKGCAICDCMLFVPSAKKKAPTTKKMANLVSKTQMNENELKFYIWLRAQCLHVIFKYLLSQCGYVTMCMSEWTVCM